MHTRLRFFDEPDVFQLVRDSTASRKVFFKGNNRARSIVGTFTHMEKDGFRVVFYESLLELMTAYQLEALPGLQDLREQPFAVVYTASNGDTRKHTFDYQITLKGERVAVACKMKNSAIRRQLKLELGLIRAQNAKRFDDVWIVTNESFTRDDALEAEFKHFMIAEVDHEADAITLEVLRDLRSPVTIHEFVARCGLRGRSWRSLIRAMRLGFAQRTAVGGRVDDYSTLIERVAEWPVA
jgi:hypothetical protein